MQLFSVAPDQLLKTAVEDSDFVGHYLSTDSRLLEGRSVGVQFFKFKDILVYHGLFSPGRSLKTEWDHPFGRVQSVIGKDLSDLTDRG